MRGQNFILVDYIIDTQQPAGASATIGAVIIGARVRAAPAQ